MEHRAHAPPKVTRGLVRRLVANAGRASIVYAVLMVIAFGSAVIAAYAWPALLEPFGP